MSHPSDEDRALGYAIYSRLTDLHRRDESHFGPFLGDLSLTIEYEREGEQTRQLSTVEWLYLILEYHEDNPEAIIFGDAMSDILAFFYEPFRALADELEARVGGYLGQPIQVFVMPCVEDTSFIIITNTNAVLLEESAKHWNFHFPDATAFRKYLTDCYRRAERELLLHKGDL